MRLLFALSWTVCHLSLPPGTAYYTGPCLTDTFIILQKMQFIIKKKQKHF